MLKKVILFMDTGKRDLVYGKVWIVEFATGWNDKIVDLEKTS